MKTLVSLIFLLAAPAFAVESGIVAAHNSRATITVLVDDQEGAVERLVKEAEARGGYFKERSNQGVVAKIPVAKLDDYLIAVASLGAVAERKIERKDLGDQRTRLTVGIATREQMMKRYLESMNSSKDREDFQTIQVATGELIAEVEKAKGALRVLDHHARFAEVDVSFKLRDRTPIKLQRQNRFAWLSSIDLNGLLADFERRPKENR